MIGIKIASFHLPLYYPKSINNNKPMKHFFWLVLFIPHCIQAQKLKKADKAIVTNLQSHIAYLADDKLEGRRTGTNGEKLAYEYIGGEFTKAGIAPKGDNGTYLQQFEVRDGKAIHPSSHFIINGHDLKMDQEYFPLSYSPNISLEATAAIAMNERGGPWFFDIKDLIETNLPSGKQGKNNPHFDLNDAIQTKAAEVAKKGATTLIIYNTGTVDDGLKFDPTSKATSIAIPILYITKKAKAKYCTDETATLDIKIKVLIEEKKRYGHNIIGYLNNNAPKTIIIGAHYDHLGYGEDHNSLFSGTTPQIHNGADDNASGSAAVIELSKLLKASKLKNNNYLFVSFSGEELGLFGSKYFTDHPTIDLNTVNYMVNLDMVGRLSDSSHGLTIGGYGTSPVWGEIFSEKEKFFAIKFDSSGTGPSDHTSFYRKNILVLFFFTGLHTDYHKPTDDADKINYTGELQVVKYIYHIIETTDKKGKLSFTKTREMAMGSKTTFKVTLGIMPDYTFGGTGVRADGISEGKVAQKAGIKAGDILIQLGEYTFTDVQTYMEILAKFNKGDATKVKVKRGKEELVFDIVF
jgi:aminopeptidase YwaD